MTYKHLQRCLHRLMILLIVGQSVWCVADVHPAGSPDVYSSAAIMMVDSHSLDAIHAELANTVDSGDVEGGVAGSTVDGPTQLVQADDCCQCHGNCLHFLSVFDKRFGFSLRQDLVPLPAANFVAAASGSPYRPPRA